MSEAAIGYWIRRFLLEHLVRERNLARNTQLGYRDAFALLVPFVARETGRSVDTLEVTDLSADLLRKFLANLESTRGCSPQTRNQRLAAVHAFARFVGEHSVEHIAWCAQIRLVPFKKTSANVSSPSSTNSTCGRASVAASTSKVVRYCQSARPTHCTLASLSR